jgi:drug/metabolite transporter (DMT)-like permease
MNQSNMYRLQMKETGSAAIPATCAIPQQKYMKPSHLLLLILMNGFWATTYSAFKLLSPVLDATDIATLRYGLAAAILFLFWFWLPGSSPRGRDLALAIVMGVIAFGFSPRLQVAGVQMGRAGDAAVLIALDPLIVSLCAAVFLRERIGPRRGAVFLAGLAGVAMVAEVWRPGFRLPALTADALIVLSLFCDAASSILGKGIVQRNGLLKVLAIAVASGALTNFLMGGASSLRAAHSLSLWDWSLVAYLAIICTVAGYLLWFAVIRETEVNTAALTIFVQPVAGTAIAVFLLGESLHWGQVIGGVVIGTALLLEFSSPAPAPVRG